MVTVLSACTAQTPQIIDVKILEPHNLCGKMQNILHSKTDLGSKDVFLAELLKYEDLLWKMDLFSFLQMLHMV